MKYLLVFIHLDDNISFHRLATLNPFSPLLSQSPPPLMGEMKRHYPRKFRSLAEIKRMGATQRILGIILSRDFQHSLTLIKKRLIIVFFTVQIIMSTLRSALHWTTERKIRWSIKHKTDLKTSHGVVLTWRGRMHRHISGKIKIYSC